MQLDEEYSYDATVESRGGAESGTGPTGFYAETMTSQQAVILGSATDRVCIIENKYIKSVSWLHQSSHQPKNVYVYQQSLLWGK